MAPLVWFKDPAGQHRPVRLETLAGDEQTEFIESAEGGQIRDGEHVSAVADGSVGHVEVFQDDRVGAFILRRPRRLSRHRHASPTYTLNCEEPHCPGVVVHAFEPARIPFSALQENMRRHRIPGGCRQVALWGKPGFRSFTYYPQTTLMSGMYADVGVDQALTRAFLRNSGFNEQNAADVLTRKYEAQSSLARVSTLSREIASLHVERVDLLKLDVEKSELHVLRGMADGDWPKLRQVVAEVHDIDARLAEFTGLLSARGFDVAVEQKTSWKVRISTRCSPSGCHETGCH
jgi:FkbM family methyltransferase